MEHHAIYDGTGGGSGYVVSYIPESDHAPHQVVGRLQYYIRAGSDFVPAPHQVLAGMFGRRPQPNMFHMFTVLSARSEGESILCKYEIVITNGGPGIARDLFFTAMVHSTPGDNTNVVWSIQDGENWTGNFSFGKQLSIISKPTVRVPPSAFLIPLSLVVNFRPPFMDRLTLKGNIGCTGSPTMNFEIDNDPSTISRLYDEYFVNLGKNETPQNYCHQLAVDLLNIAENVEAKT